MINHVEKKLRRMRGMSPERLEEVHRLNAKELWTGRCWNCRQTTTAVRSDLQLCSHCGKNLWSRDE